MTAIRIDGNVLAAKSPRPHCGRSRRAQARASRPVCPWCWSVKIRPRRFMYATKVAACGKVGMHSVMHKLATTTTEAGVDCIAQRGCGDLTAFWCSCRCRSTSKEKKVLEAVAAHKGRGRFPRRKRRRPDDWRTALRELHARWLHGNAYCATSA